MVTGAYNLHSYNHRSNKKRKNRQNNFSVNSASQNLQMFVTHNVSKPQLSFPDDLMNHFYEMGLTGGYHTTTLIQTIVFCLPCHHSSQLCVLTTWVGCWLMRSDPPPPFPGGGGYLTRLWLVCMDKGGASGAEEPDGSTCGLCKLAVAYLWKTNAH